MSDPQNYMLHVYCPHCNAHHLVAISGFGGELATREKFCSTCEKPYFVHLISQTSGNDDEIRDGQIRSIKSTIKYLQQERKKTLAQLLIQHDMCLSLYRENLVTAVDMRSKHKSN